MLLPVAMAAGEGGSQELQYIDMLYHIIKRLMQMFLINNENDYYPILQWGTLRRSKVSYLEELPLTPQEIFVLHPLAITASLVTHIIDI